MDSFDYKDESLQPTKDRGAVVWNILTILVLLTACCIALGFAAIFINPYTGYNPFPPPTLPPTLAIPTQTPTPKPKPTPLSVSLEFRHCLYFLYAPDELSP